MKRSLFFIFFSVCLCVTLVAQRTVLGKVTDETGTGVAGASILVRNMNLGTQTKTDGTFSLSVPGSGTFDLVISSAGYKPQTITTSGTDVISVALQKEVSSLEDVVVIGYGTARRRDLTGSVSSVSARQLRDVPVNSAAEALAGRLAGVQITRTEGAPNADGFVGVRKLANKLEVMSPYDFVTYQWERRRSNVTDSTGFANTYGTNWDTLQNYKNAPMADCNVYTNIEMYINSITKHPL